METVRCDLCGADAPSPYLLTTDRFTRQAFHLSKCSHCGLVYLTPRPTQQELERYYPDDYEAYVLPEQRGSKLDEWHIWRVFQMQLDYVERLPDRGQLLEIGCGTGTFLKKARERGWYVEGLDVVDKAIKIARDHYQLKIYTTNLECLELSEESMDAVVMWDVLEHLPSPKRALERVYRLLNSKGMLFFSIPNIQSFDRYLFGKNWIGWDVPRHFFLYDSETIHVLLKKTGFKLVNQRCLLGGKGTFNLSLGRLLENKPGVSWLKRSYPMLGAVLWPYRQLAYLLRRGPIMYYAVRKADQ
jgi:SAM-dependent methyltransferase